MLPFSTLTLNSIQAQALESFKNSPKPPIEVMINQLVNSFCSKHYLSFLTKALLTSNNKQLSNNNNNNDLKYLKIQGELVELLIKSSQTTNAKKINKANLKNFVKQRIQSHFQCKPQQGVPFYIRLWDFYQSLISNLSLEREFKEVCWGKMIEMSNLLNDYKNDSQKQSYYLKHNLLICLSFYRMFVFKEARSLREIWLSVFKEEFPTNQQILHIRKQKKQQQQQQQQQQYLSSNNAVKMERRGKVSKIESAMPVEEHSTLEINTAEEEEDIFEAYFRTSTETIIFQDD